MNLDTHLIRLDSQVVRISVLGSEAKYTSSVVRYKYFSISQNQITSKRSRRSSQQTTSLSSTLSCLTPFSPHNSFPGALLEFFMINLGLGVSLKSSAPLDRPKGCGLSTEQNVDSDSADSGGQASQRTSFLLLLHPHSSTVHSPASRVSSTV